MELLPFYLILIILFIVPTLLGVGFPGWNNTSGQIKRYINEYPYYILVSEGTGISRLLLALFTKAKNNKRPIIYYTRVVYLIIVILQIPIAIIVYYLKINVFIVYFWALVAICVIPHVFLFIMLVSLEYKEKAYKKKMGIKIETFWDYLKADRKHRKLEKQYKQQNAIRNAIEPYIKINNPKKRKETIDASDIEKVNAVLEKDFPNAYAKLTTDEKGNKIFCVYYKGKEDELLIKAFFEK